MRPCPRSRGSGARAWERARHGGRIYGIVVGRAQRPALELGLVECQHFSGAVRAHDVGTKFATEPDRITDELHRFDIQVRAGQVALLRAFVDDEERNFAIGIVQERGLEVLDSTRLPVRLDVVKHQQRIGAVLFRAEAIVGHDPKAAVLHRLDAGESL